ncbi:MAG: hypothetical protein WCS70_07905 [Verrucomicrobiota bacterium]
MKPRCAGWLLTFLLLVTAGQAETNAPLNTAISVTRQFTAYAPGRTLPAALCVFAERLKHEWLIQLDLPDTWRDPIVLVVRENARTNSFPAPLNLTITQIGPVVKYEIAGSIPPPIEERDFATVIVRVLCLEAANRTRPYGTVTNWQSVVIPLWLARGLSESIQGRPEWLIPVALRAANSARPPGAADVMRVTVMPGDEASGELFAANAWLLTKSLLRLPNGTQKLRLLLGKLAWTTTFKEAFWSVYRNDFDDEMALEKWWSLQPARLATIVTLQNLAATETAQRLTALLTFPGGRQFNALERFSEQPWLRAELTQRMVGFQSLYAKGHPMYRSVIALYIEAANLLTAEKLSRYRRVVQEADKQRAGVENQLREINVVLDRAEEKFGGQPATNAFQGYFRILEEADKFEKQRRNPISDYLDKFDR